MIRPVGASRPVIALVAVAAVLGAPAVVAAHAELVKATPAEGSIVEGNPPFINGQYSQRLDPDGSTLALLDPSGTRIARGGVVAARNTPRQMWIESLPPLAPGTYTVRSTTKSAVDGDVERVTWSFTVTAPPPTPTPTPSEQSGAPATTEPSATLEPTASPTPAASPAPGSDAGSGSDVILPIIAAMAIITIGAGLLLSRGRRGPSS
jgi:copper resistance protein C